MGQGLPSGQLQGMGGRASQPCTAVRVPGSHLATKAPVCGDSTDCQGPSPICSDATVWPEMPGAPGLMWPFLSIPRSCATPARGWGGGGVDWHDSGGCLLGGEAGALPGNRKPLAESGSLPWAQGDGWGEAGLSQSWTAAAGRKDSGPCGRACAWGFTPGLFSCLPSYSTRTPAGEDEVKEARGEGTCPGTLW